MKMNRRILAEPSFKKFYPECIDRYIEAVHKVADNCGELHAEKKNEDYLGGMALTKRVH